MFIWVEHKTPWRVS